MTGSTYASKKYVRANVLVAVTEAASCCCPHANLSAYISFGWQSLTNLNRKTAAGLGLPTATSRRHQLPAAAAVGGSGSSRPAMEGATKTR